MQAVLILLVIGVAIAIVGGAVALTYVLNRAVDPSGR